MNLWQLIPPAMILLGVGMLAFALIIDGARRDRHQKAIYRAEMARRALARALTPDPQVNRRIGKWS